MVRVLKTKLQHHISKERVDLIPFEFLLSIPYNNTDLCHRNTDCQSFISGPILFFDTEILHCCAFLFAFVNSF